MNKWILLLLCFSMSAFSDDKPLRVGTLDFYPPYVTRLQAAGGFSGFDIDVMHEVCERIEKECVYNGFRFDELFSLILADEIDVAVGAVLITKGREELVLFSDPYIDGHMVFLVGKNQPTQGAQKGLLVGVLQNMFPDETLKQLNVDPGKIKNYDNLDDLMNDLTEGKISKGLMDRHVAEYWLNSTSYEVSPITISKQVGDGYGIVLSPKNQELKNQINKALQDMENDGTYISIYNKYFAE